MWRSFFLMCMFTQAALAAPIMRSIKQEMAASQGRPGYQLEASYPDFPTGVSPRVNQACLALLKADLERFKGNYQHLSTGGSAWSYQARCRLEMETSDLVSILYSVTAHEDGAHPRFYFLTLACSPKSGQIWHLSQQKLKPLSRYCIADLKKQLKLKAGAGGEAQIEQGAAPRMENFRAVLPTPQGLRIYFRTDQIGPNLLGTRTVTVPYSNLP
ncbi:DUF3298 domain-containing protein [bacterium]|nr:DUF3298 domain-containing protein [bacterium]